MGIGEAVDTIPSILNKCLFGRKGKTICLPTLAGGRHNYNSLSKFSKLILVFLL